MTGANATWHSQAVSVTNDLIVRCKDGVIVDANARAVEVLGEGGDSPVGRNLLDIVGAGERSAVAEALRSPDGRIGLPCSVNVATGDRLDLEANFVHVAPEPDEGPESIYVLIVARDVSERLRAAEALLRSEVQSRELVDRSIDFICLCEKELIRFMNPAGLRMIGVSDGSKILGKPLADIFHKDYRPILDGGLAHLAGDGEVIPMKMVTRRHRVIDVECAVTAMPEASTFVVEAREITERVRSAQRVRDREELLHGIVDSVAEGIITVTEEGIVSAFNKAAETIFGWRATDIIGHPVELLMPEARREEQMGWVETRNRSRSPKEKGTPLHMEGLSVGGRTFPLEAGISNLRKGRRRLFVWVVRDITDRMAAEEALRQSNEALEQRVEERTRALTQEITERRKIEESLQLTARVIDTTSEGVVLTDPQFKITSVNPAFGRITGYSTNEVVGRTPRFHAAIVRNTEMYDRMMTALREKSQWEGEMWTSRKDGSRYAQRLSISAIRREDGELLRYAILVSDITQRKEDEERILYQANYDALTGLPNRSLFRDRLDQALTMARRQDRKVVLMFIDLDGFKLVNDTLGHDMGDLLLKQASDRLLDCVRQTDTVSRLGGDEFTIILAEIADEHHAPVVAQRVIDALSQPFSLEGQEAFVSASIGITTFPDDSDNATDLLKNADAAMYRAKEKGKSNYQYFTSEMNEEVKERLFLKNGLSMALDKGEFELFYQPKMGLEENWITGVEALMRWQHPELGMVSPGRFIPVLEESGLVVDVGNWVLREACSQHVRWLNMGLPPIRVAVNLSARQLRDPALVKVVESVLKETGVGPEALEIEITESMLMSDHGPVIKVLGALHEMGLHVAMDDFGTGYSSLSYLKRFPIDTIKIDRSFVADIAVDKDDAEIIRTIINMGQSLKRRVVAEGVEVVEQLDILKAYRCHEVQGYYFSRPLPADNIIEYITDLKKDRNR